MAPLTLADLAPKMDLRALVKSPIVRLKAVGPVVTECVRRVQPGPSWGVAANSTGGDEADADGSVAT